MDAKAYAARNRQGSDWFAHKPDAQNPAAQQQQSPPQQQTHNDQAAVVDPPASARTQMVRPVCNSNQWFKHGEQQNNATPKKEVEAKAETVAAGEKSTCASWCMGGGETKGQEADHRSRSVTKEGEAYCIRDKAGSDWFSHDKGGDSGSQAVSTPRVGSVEGSHNASRMRGESENWFSHDPNAPAEPLHSSKGRPQSKALNSNMFNVFHHDQ